jgi:dTDP-4-dehydrorhamnose reductase
MCLCKESGQTDYQGGEVRPKVLIFGGSGFIGGSIAFKALDNWDVSVVSRSKTELPAGIRWYCADVTDESEVKRLFDKLKPDACVNAAALSKIDRAEEDKNLAWKINVDGAENVAACCGDSGIRHIFFSSDAVYKGSAEMYYEDDVPDPVNYYGKTKAAAEKVVLSLAPGAVLIRISLVLGFPVTDVPCYYTSIRDKLKKPGHLSFPDDEYRTPVDVLTLSECVIELLEKEFKGVLHIGSTGYISRYKLTGMIAEMMGFDRNRIRVLPRGDRVPGKAPRHKNGILDVSKARALLKTPLLSVEDGVRRTFKDLTGDK